MNETENETRGQDADNMAGQPAATMADLQQSARDLREYMHRLNAAGERIESSDVFGHLDCIDREIASIVACQSVKPTAPDRKSVV